MGELVVGRPALRLNYVVSLPLDLISVMSLLYRAVPGSGLDPWLIESRKALPVDLRQDLDLLHGFSGRLLYFMEEAILRFEPLRPDRGDATFDDLIGFLSTLPAFEYRLMIERALDRVHRDLGTSMMAPVADSDDAWRVYIEPAITTATSSEVVRFLADPESLKVKVLTLIRGVWDHLYASEWDNRLSTLREAAQLATGTAGFGFALAFVELTGNRMPSTLITGTNAVEAVTFCPSYHIGSFISFTIYPPDLIVYFDAPGFIQRMRPRVTTASNGASAPAAAVESTKPLTSDEVLESIRALGDPNRLRVIDLLSGGELYAQEIVGRLGIAQSAVSRHLALLERAGLVKVRPRGGMKYYAVDCARLDALADALRGRGRVQ